MNVLSTAMPISSVSTDSDALLGGLFATFGMMYIVVLVAAVFLIVCQWKIFTKAGEHGWASIVPFYGNYVTYKMTWGHGWMFLLCLIPFVNVVISIITNIKLAKVFGKGAGFAIGLIFLPIFFMPMLAFGDVQYQGPDKI